MNPLAKEARIVASGGIGKMPISDLVGGLLTALEQAEHRADFAEAQYVRSCEDRVTITNKLSALLTHVRALAPLVEAGSEIGHCRALHIIEGDFSSLVDAVDDFLEVFGRDARPALEALAKLAEGEA